MSYDTGPVELSVVALLGYLSGGDWYGVLALGSLRS